MFPSTFDLEEWKNSKCKTDLCLDIKDETKLVYKSKKSLYGVKLKHLDCIPNIIGGEIINYEFSIDKTSNTFQSNYTDTPIPEGAGILVEFDAPIYQSCLDQIVFYEDAGWVISHVFNPVYGCMDKTACNFDPRANKKTRNCKYPPEHYDCSGNCISDIDCTGKCGGIVFIDECGICGGDNSSCADCAGVPNGNNQLDNCGNCDNDKSNDCIEDCSGVWGGNKTIDGCGICGGDNSSCADCAGIPNGNNLLDNCGNCDNDKSNDCIEDCSGVWGGNKTIDGCGICGGDNSSCADCAGIPNGNNLLDNCGNCDNDKSNDCIQDCSGVWGGNKIVDECGICGGDNSSCADCAGVPNGTAFLDDCSICSSGTTGHITNSDKDCFGVCFGNEALDCAGICGGKTKIDCAKVCGGSSQKDRCGICDGDNTSCGATYAWPTDASKTLTAFFGEDRPNRYHAGIDIRTYGQVGNKLFATSDGYIKKISVSTKGYGKAIYYQLDDGNVAVYAHLNNFTDEVDEIVQSLQKKYEKYSLLYNFGPNEFRFKKGEVIGYAGDTGTISGPHLHYELRDSSGLPFNALHEYNITDNKSPIAKNIAFIPLSYSTSINGLQKPQVFSLKKMTSNIYELTDTVAINNKFGLAIHAVDKIDMQPFSYGIYKIELYIDDDKTYEVSYDVYDYQDARYIYNERDYQLKVDTGNTFYRLFCDINKEMLFIHPKYSNEYILFEDNSYHDFKIIISDFNNNKTHVSGTILNKRVPILETIYEDNFISFNNIQNNILEYNFNFTGKHDSDKVISSKNTFISNNILELEYTEKPFSILEINLSSRDGVKYTPQYLQIIQDDIPFVNGSIHLEHYKHGIILHFKCDEFINQIPYLTYEENGYKKRLTMHRISKNSFETNLLKTQEFNNYTDIQINFDVNPKKIFKYNIEKKITSPEDKFKLLYDSGQIILKGNKHTFHDTTLIWIEAYNPIIKNQNVNIVTKPIYIGPNRLSPNKAMELTIKLPHRSLLEYSSICKYNPSNEEWKYVSSFTDKNQIALRTDIKSGGIYAVLKDEKPPVITNIYPGNGGSYYQNDFRKISFDVIDNDSGINDEHNIQLQIDDMKPLIFEYNTYRNQVIYKLDQKLDVGEHTFKINLSDNVGNKLFYENKFYIK